MLSHISSTLFPLAIAFPHLLLRLKDEKQVNIRSPTPDNPASVYALPPIALQTNLISLEPLVTIAATVELP